jgi:pimeloyl-ACP methyl ester carboxylesterase
MSTTTARAHDGAPIEIRIHGTGPTLLMHALPAYPGLDAPSLEIKSRVDPALVDALSGRYRLVMSDYPGQAKPDTLTPENVVKDLLAIADAADAERFAWCGYSWTAVIGLQLAIASDRLTALLCGGWPPINAPYDVTLRISRQPAGVDWPMTSAPPATHQQFVTFYTPLQDFDDRAAQERITCPRLCFAGSADDIAGSGIGRIILETREELERWGWDVHIIDGLDHMQVLEPEVFIPAITPWLDAHLL